MSDDLAGVAWRVSTRSSDNGANCVEAGPFVDGSGRYAVRDSKDRDGAVIVCTGSQWAAFLAGVHGGTFDRG